MELIADTRYISMNESGLFVAIGKWDGVHLAHQRVISSLVAEAQQAGGRSVVVGFHPLPMSVLRPDEAPPILQTLGERAEVMAAMGVDVHLAIPFHREFADMTPARFVREVLVGELQSRKVMVGFNFTFGQGGKGTAETLRILCAEQAVPVEVFGPVRIDGENISSTEVRFYVASGDVQRAAHLLGRPFSVTGVVVQGDQRGRLLGYPTANLLLEQKRQLPAAGVYAARATVLAESGFHAEGMPCKVWPRTGSSYHAMLNIGWRPTFQGSDLRCEVHLFDFSSDLYGKELRVEFLQRLRGEQSFGSAEALRDQLARDETTAREFLSAYDKRTSR